MHFSSPFRLLRPLFLLAGLLLGAGSRLFAQAPVWQDAFSPGMGRGESTAVDSAGNVYLTGTFDGTATFGTTTLSSAGGADIFVAKRTPAGVWQWATRAGGISDDFGTGLAVDGSGSVVVTGTFDGTATFGATTLTNANAMGVDLFVAKLTPTGAWQWAAGAGGSRNDFTFGVAVAGSGSVVVTGYFSSPTLAFGATTLTLTGGHDLFVAQLTPTGVWQWATRAGSSGDDLSFGVAVDGSGSVVVTGSFDSPTLTFGATTLTNASTTGDPDVFVAKLTPLGAWQWATGTVGGGGPNQSIDVTVDGSGSVVVAGRFDSPTLTFGATTLTNAGIADIFVAKLTPTGAWQWATGAGGIGGEYGIDVAVDGTGSVLVSGLFNSPTIGFGATTLTNAGDSDLFVAKLTPQGAWQWATSAGGNDYDVGNGVAVAGSGNVVVTGSFFSPITAFGPITLTNPNPANPAIFLARLSTVTGLPVQEGEPGLTLWPNPAHGTVRLSTAVAAGAVQLLDGLGRPVRTWPAALARDLDLDRDLSGVPAGVYTVRTGTQARRLVVQ